MRHQRTLALLTLLALLGSLVGAVPAFASPSPDAFVDGPVPPWGWQRFDAQYYAPQGRIYFLGGRTAGADTIDPSIWYFDTATSTYVDTGVDLQTGVANHFIVQLTDATGTGLYVFSGSTTLGTVSTAVQVYYPETNTVTTITDAWPGTSTDPEVGCPAFPGAAVVADNKAYVFGGFASASSGCAQDSMSAETWIFDPMAAAGSRFTAGPDLSVARAYIPSAVVDHYIYAAGGDMLPTLTVTPLTERLDLTNPVAWDDAGVADLPVASSGLAGCDEVEAFGFNTVSGTELAGKLVVVGCGQWTAELPDSFIYDVATNTWASWDNLNTARRNYAGALESSASTVRIWVFGGRSGSDTGIASSEYRDVAIAPTSVKLVGLNSRSEPALPLPLALALGVLVVVLGAAGLKRARAAR